MIERTVSRVACAAAVVLLLCGAGQVVAQGPGGFRYQGGYPGGPGYAPPYTYQRDYRYANPDPYTRPSSYDSFFRYTPTYEPRSYLYPDAFLPNVYRPNTFGYGYLGLGDVTVPPGAAVRNPFLGASYLPRSSAAYTQGSAFPPTYPSPAIYPPVPLPAAGMPAAPSPPAPANVVVQVPADAEVWFDGYKTRQTGARRTFTSPPLERGRTFTYEVKARWTQDGKPVERTQQVKVQGGETSEVEFRTDGGQ
jgi:uncharacterized protein (TIGR03000 family)